MERPIENFMEMTTQKIKELIDVDTTVGKPIVTPDGRTIIPISKMTFGMVSGGGEYGSASKAKSAPADSAELSEQTSAEKSDASDSSGNSFAGGAASGVSITPVAFMIITADDVKIMPAERAATIYDEILDRFPEILREVKKLFPEKEEAEADDEAADETPAEEKKVKKYILVEENE